MGSRLSRKFLFSRKSHSLVNLVAIISVIAVLVPTSAMIVVLSLHNGLSNLVHSIYSNFDSELTIVPSEGQYFELDSTKLYSINELCLVSGILECNTLLEYNGVTGVAMTRGVDSNFVNVSGMSEMVQRGEWVTRKGDLYRGVLGAGIGYNMAIPLSGATFVNVMAVMPPTTLMRRIGVPILQNKRLKVEGVYSIDAGLDSRYLFTDIDFVRELLGGKSGYSSVELKVREKTEKGVKEKVQRIVAEQGLKVVERKEQRPSIYSAIDAEKFVIYMVLIFVGLIAIMSLAGCSLMMTAEKAHSVAVLRTMGMTSRGIRAIFVRLSMIIVGIGVGGGVILGTGLVLLQQNFGVLKTAENSLSMESYPVELMVGDIILTIVSIGIVGLGMVWVTLRRVNFSKVK